MKKIIAILILSLSSQSFAGIPPTKEQISDLQNYSREKLASFLKDSSGSLTVLVASVAAVYGAKYLEKEIIALGEEKLITQNLKNEASKVVSQLVDLDKFIQNPNIKYGFELLKEDLKKKNAKEVAEVEALQKEVSQLEKMVLNSINPSVRRSFYIMYENDTMPLVFRNGFAIDDNGMRLYDYGDQKLVKAFEQKEGYLLKREEKLILNHFSYDKLWTKILNSKRNATDLAYSLKTYLLEVESNKIEKQLLSRNLLSRVTLFKKVAEISARISGLVIIAKTFSLSTLKYLLSVKFIAPTFLSFSNEMFGYSSVDGVSKLMNNRENLVFMLNAQPEAISKTIAEWSPDENTMKTKMNYLQQGLDKFWSQDIIKITKNLEEELSE